MKTHLLALLVLILASFPAASKENLTDDELFEACDQHAATFRTVLKSRQEETPLSVAINAALDAGISLDLVKKTYEIPVYRTEKLRKENSKELVDLVYANCLEDMDLVD